MRKFIDWFRNLFRKPKKPSMPPIITDVSGFETDDAGNVVAVIGPGGVRTPIFVPTPAPPPPVIAAPVLVPFSTSIPLDSVSGKYMAAVSPPVNANFVVGNNPVQGGTCQICLIGDGVNTPTLPHVSNGYVYDKTAGKRNVYTFTWSVGAPIVTGASDTVNALPPAPPAPTPPAPAPAITAAFTVEPVVQQTAPALYVLTDTSQGIAGLQNVSHSFTVDDGVDPAQTFTGVGPHNVYVNNAGTVTFNHRVTVASVAYDAQAITRSVAAAAPPPPTPQRLSFTTGKNTSDTHQGTGWMHISATNPNKVYNQPEDNWFAITDTDRVVVGPDVLAAITAEGGTLDAVISALPTLIAMNAWSALTVSIHALLEPFNPDQVTWLNRTSGAAWSTPGGVFGPSLGTMTVVEGQSGSYTWPSALADALYANTAARANGFLIMRQGGGDGSVFYNHLAPSDGVRPYVTIVADVFVASSSPSPSPAPAPSPTPAPAPTSPSSGDIVAAFSTAPLDQQRGTAAHPATWTLTANPAYAVGAVTHQWSATNGQTGNGSTFAVTVNDAAAGSLKRVKVVYRATDSTGAWDEQEVTLEALGDGIATIGAQQTGANSDAVKIDPYGQGMPYKGWEGSTVMVSVPSILRWVDRSQPIYREVHCTPGFYSVNQATFGSLPSSGDLYLISSDPYRSIAPLPDQQVDKAPATATRPAHSTGVGFFVTKRGIYDANGNKFRFRGINRGHYDQQWGPQVIASKAPVERTRLYMTGHDSRTNYADVQAIQTPELNLMKANGIAMILGSWHSFQGFGISQAEKDARPVQPQQDERGIRVATQQWVDHVAEFQPWERWAMFCNINEWGPSCASDGTCLMWRDEQIASIQAMRAAGYKGTITANLTDWAQGWQVFIKHAREVFEADPEHNVIFDYHVYGFVQSGELAWRLSMMRAAHPHIPVFIGEFGPGRNVGFSPTTIESIEVMRVAERYNVPWIAWAIDDEPQYGDNFFSLLNKRVWEEPSVSPTNAGDRTLSGEQVFNDAELGTLNFNGGAGYPKATVFP